MICSSLLICGVSTIAIMCFNMPGIHKMLHMLYHTKHPGEFKNLFHHLVLTGHTDSFSFISFGAQKNRNYTRRKLSHATNDSVIADCIRSLTSHVPGLQNTKSKWSWGGTAGKILQPSSSGWEPILLPIPPDWNLLHMVHTSYYQLYFLAPITDHGDNNHKKSDNQNAIKKSLKVDRINKNYK